MPKIDASNALQKPATSPNEGGARAEGAAGVPTEIELTVIAPSHNEQDNLRALVDEISAALAPLGMPFECVIVDDHSTDRTRAVVMELMATRPWLRCVAMLRDPLAIAAGPKRGLGGGGQSAAFHAGFRAAQGRLVATLDADLQNDPADLPGMLKLLRESNADMVQGDRSAARRDNMVRRIGSIVGRKFRLWLLGDTIRDTGCSLRVLRREVALRLPLELKGMHRFIPVTARHLGYMVVEYPVHHRPRTAGETKYGMGITKRAIPGLIDLLAVRYMRNRRRPVVHAEVAVSDRSAANSATDGRVARLSHAGGHHGVVVVGDAGPAASSAVGATP